jgi:hypothetical protein
MDEHLLEQLKQIALRERRSLAALTEDFLREAVARHLRPSKSPAVELPEYGEGGVAQGVDLADTKWLLDFAEQGLPLEKRG